MDVRASWTTLALVALGLAGCADDGGAAPVEPAFDDLGLQATATTWDPLESTCRHASLSIL